MIRGLIFAQADAEAAEHALAATLPIGGATVIETQADALVRAGVSDILVVSGRVPGPLSLAIERLRRRGLVIELVRRPEEIVERLAPRGAVLVLADGCIIDDASLRRLASSRDPALLVTRDSGDPVAIERIDGQDHWAGAMRTDAETIDATIARLGEWDLLSTLLRRVAQARPERIAAAEGEVLRVRDVGDARAYDAGRLTLLADGPGPWIERRLRRWVAVPLIRWRRLEGRPGWAFAAAAGGAGALALGALAMGWTVAGLVSLTVALVALTCARLESGLRTAEPGWVPWIALAIAAVAMLGSAGASGWSGAWPVAIGGIAALALGNRAGAEALPWAASPASILVLLLVGTLLGVPAIALVLVAVVALAGLAVAVERLRDGAATEVIRT